MNTGGFVGLPDEVSGQNLSANISLGCGCSFEPLGDPGQKGSRRGGERYREKLCAAFAVGWVDGALFTPRIAYAGVDVRCKRQVGAIALP